MEKLLQSLLESEVLTPETSEQLREAYTSLIEKHKAEAGEAEAEKVRAELTEQWVVERELIIESIDAKTQEFLEAHLNQFRDDVERFRDLEAEYAEKLIEAKAGMTEELKQDMAVLLKNIDEFLEDRISIEFDELREDIEIAKQDRFGRQIFEAYSEMFSANFVDEDSTQAKLHEANDKLTEALNTASDLAKQNEKLVRESAISRLLQPLTGRQRDIMETILSTTTTSKLDETYEKFIGRVVTESVDPKSEKEGTVLAEGDEPTPDKKISESVIVKTGNSAESAAEQINENQKLSEDSIKRLRILAGNHS